jgi:hypothetical protein
LKRPQSPSAQKRRQAWSPTKSLLIAFFFNVKGIVHCEFVPPNTTVNSDLYCVNREPVCALENCQWCGEPCFSGAAISSVNSHFHIFSARTTHRKIPLLLHGADHTCHLPDYGFIGPLPALGMARTT